MHGTDLFAKNFCWKKFFNLIFTVKSQHRCSLKQLPTGQMSATNKDPYKLTNKQMKALLFLTLFMIAANTQTIWDNWHNVPTTWVPSNTTSNTYGLSGWKRNGLDGKHFSGYFNNYSQIYTQYMYWKVANPNTLILCGPKYYLFTESLCRVNPYFKSSSMKEYCVPNYFNYPGKVDACSLSIALAQTHGCCYENNYNQNPTFIKNIKSVDSYSTPIW